MPARASCQNDLALHKRYLKRRNRPMEAEALMNYYRAELRRLRGTVG